MRKKVKKAQRGITKDLDALKKLRTRGRRNVERAERPLLKNKPKGIIKPKLSTGKVDTTKRNNKTKKQLILDALKKAPLGSNKRRTLYNRLGWKQDDTTTGYKKAKVTVKKSGLITPTSSKTMSGKVSTAKKASVSKPVSKMAKKVSATRAKGKAALASGNKAKALRMKKKEARQTKRAVRKSKRK
jgi:hypothetical protein